MRTVPVGSISLGRWLGTPARLHASFLVVALFVLYVTTTAQPGNGPSSVQGGQGLLLVLIWFVSVVLHEAGHCIAVARLGGTNDSFVFTPVGGVGEYSYLNEPHRQLMAAFAGPLANLGGALAAGCLLFALNDKSLFNMLNPLGPVGLFGGELLPSLLRMAVWVNWLLLVVNVLPAVPLDGGWAIHSLIWPALGVRKANVIVRRLSVGTAIAMGVLAWWIGRQPSATDVPAWLPLSALALMIWCYAVAPHQSDDIRSEEDGDLFGYDFSQGFTSLENGNEQAPRRSSAVRRWLERRRAEREVRRIQLEQEEERQVDAILVQLHEHGIESLTAEERALLNRVSARYRSRSQP